jgi:hypothetical protein
MIRHVVCLLRRGNWVDGCETKPICDTHTIIHMDLHVESGGARHLSLRSVAEINSSMTVLLIPIKISYQCFASVLLSSQMRCSFF